MNNLLNLICDLGVVFSRFGLESLNGFRSNLTQLQVVNSNLFALMWFEFLVVQDGRNISTITKKMVVEKLNHSAPIVIVENKPSFKELGQDVVGDENI